MKKQNQLSKSEMKRILGGVDPVGGCSVSGCLSPFFACCHTQQSSSPSCGCTMDTGGDYSYCEDGGPGSTSCSITT